MGEIESVTGVFAENIQHTWAELNIGNVAQVAMAAQQIASISNSLMQKELNNIQTRTRKSTDLINKQATNEIATIKRKVKAGTITEQQGADSIALI